MKLSAMKELLEFYVDDIVDIDIALVMFNVGKDRMATAVSAQFPDLEITPDLAQEYVFDKRFHETPVLYAAAQVKAQDSSIREKESFLQQFNAGVGQFAANYRPLMQYRDEDFIEQYRVTAALEKDFTISKPWYDSNYQVEVYVNNRQVPFFRTGNLITLNVVPVNGDYVSVMWDANPNYIRPEMGW